MLYLVLQMYLVLKLWFTVSRGEYVYKKIPGTLTLPSDIVNFRTTL